MKRTEIVAQSELVPPPEQQVLVYRDGAYYHLLEDRTVHAGETAILYDIDFNNDADLLAANALFNPEFYPRARRAPWEDEARVIAEFVPASGAEVLDACCGAGRVSAALVREGNHVVAVDISEGCIANAAQEERYAAPQEKRAQVEFRVADCLNLPFADKSFDVVSCFGNSLGTFFGGRRRLLSELVRVCRRTLLLGLREDPEHPDEKHQIYASPHGFLEITQQHSLETFRQFLDVIPGPVHYRKGDIRPWGGQTWFLALDLGTDSSAGSRNT
jgi:SAM-dependent methyltransferase